MTTDIYQRLENLGITLGEPPAPKGSYLPIVIHENICYLSGSLPYQDGELLYPGIVGKDVDAENAKLAAAQCVKNSLSVIHHSLGGLDKVKRVLKLVGFVASAADFSQQPSVINGASDLLVEVFGESGRHARSAVGVSSLPLGSSVEIEMIIAI